ncbi:MAG: aspartate--tRNA ligase, partial [bacterium]|nr:aspartate--tRNA ligase [bacterium]
MRIPIVAITKKTGESVELSGWVSVRRDHGKLLFLDMRDASGVCQLVITPKSEAYAEAQKLRSEWVIQITGMVQKRPDAMVNGKIPTGTHEVSVTALTILNEATTPPFDVLTDGYEIGEEVRMQYRYVDIRRERLQKVLKARSATQAFITSFLTERGFTYVETPILTKSTPEGARDYLVPSRVEKGKFYALPQSPQQYKQLLMVGGIEKYFQIARCFRDEDTRGDRQPEFTQLDMEMAFVEEENVIQLNEELLIALMKKIFPDKKIQEIPFPRMTYADAMEKYGSDRPDLRKDKNDPNLLAFCWVVDFPFFERVKGARPEPLGAESRDEALAEGWTFTHNPFSAPKPEHMVNLLAQKNIGEILAAQYDIALNGMEIGGGSIRNHQPDALKAVFSIIGSKKESASFNHMYQALASGAPPHGGIAWGLDRLLSLLLNEPNIREVIAFPKTGDGRDLMMEAPSEVS